MPKEIPDALLGSIVECHTRGLLPETGCFEYRKGNREIDYVSNNQFYAIEMTVSNKQKRDTNFDVLPEGYRRILMTKNKEGLWNNIEHIPYYQLIYDLSKFPKPSYPFGKKFGDSTKKKTPEDDFGNR